MSHLSNLTQLVESHLSLVASSVPSTLSCRPAQHSEIKGQPCPPDDILQTPLSGSAGTMVKVLLRKCFLPGGISPACLVLGTDDGEGQPWPGLLPSLHLRPRPPSCTETRPHSPDHILLLPLTLFLTPSLPAIVCPCGLLLQLLGKWYLKRWAGDMPIPEWKWRDPLPPFTFERDNFEELEFRMNLT